MNPSNISGFDAIPAPEPEEYIDDRPFCWCESCGAAIYEGEECVAARTVWNGVIETVYYCANCARETWAGRKV